MCATKQNAQRLHCNFAIASQVRNFQKLQRNFRILHVKLHFFVSPLVPSPFGPPPNEEEVKYPLHEMIAPSLEHIEAFLADEKKEKEQASARDVHTMSWPTPSPESDSSSSTQLRPSPAELAREQAQRKKDEEEYARLVAERKADEEGFEGYWESRYAYLY